MEMRKLRAKDIFTIVDMINDLGLMPIIKDLLSGDLRKTIIKQATKKSTDEETTEETTTEETTAEEIGLDVILELIEKLLTKVPEARVKVHELFAELCGVEVATIDEMALDDYFDLYADFFKKPELRVLSKYLK